MDTIHHFKQFVLPFACVVEVPDHAFYELEVVIYQKPGNVVDST